jgi:hypothetical protein
MQRGFLAEVRLCKTMPWLIALVVVVAVAVVSVLMWRPVPSYDLAKTYPPLRDLPKPYQSVRLAYYLDGGSLGVEVRGANGTNLQFAFPVHAQTNGEPKYPRLFVGGLHLSRKPGAVQLTEITNSPDTRTMLIRLIEADAPNGVERSMALFQLRSSPTDFLQLAWYALCNRLR